MVNRSAKRLLQLICAVLMGITLPTYAQDPAVSGRVTSPDGAPVPGVSVQLKGSATGATTDEDGRFRLPAAPGSGTLVFSMLGYARQEVPYTGFGPVTVTLQSAASQVGEVVVIGYGSMRKRDLTGAVSQVKAKDIGIVATTTPLQALQGRAAGVQVMQNSGSPGGSISVRIRGTNSIQGSNEPLYVVDGFPLNGSLSLLNNADIESMEVLKDASAVAIYGSRGANGVVIITTKKGKTGAPQVDAEFGYTVQSVTNKLNMMNAHQYAQFYNEQAKNDNVAPYFSDQVVDSLAGVQGTDWQDEVLRNAPQYNTVLTLSGGGNKARYSVSGGVFRQGGIIRGSDYNRYSLRGNVEQDVSPKLSVSYSTNLTRVESSRKNSGQGNRGGSLISAMVSAPPTLSPFVNGAYRNLATSYPFISNVIINPLANIREASDNVRANKVLANVAVTYKPVDGLSVKVSGGIENEDNFTNVYTNGFTSSNGTVSNTTTGSGSVSSSNVTSILNENIINYIKVFGEHSLSATAGFTYQTYKTNAVGGGGSGFISNIQGPYDLEAAGTPGVPTSSYSAWTLISGLGRLNYSYRDKYLATVSFRADGSSRYSEQNKWGYFPAAALAWRVSEESFLQNVPWISDMKLRASWGNTGSTAISPYFTLNQLTTGQTIFGDAIFTMYAPGSRLPASLKWETTEQTDIGLDLALLDNRLRAGVDYYIKNTRDLLNTVSLPSSLGYTNTIRNIGEMQNRGFELMLEADVVRSKSVTWSLSGNLAINRNKIVKLYNGEDVLGGSINITVVNDYINRLREGEALGKFFGYVEDGYDANGKIKYVDQDKNGVINAGDKKFIGDPNPAFIYGLNSSTTWKNFELTVFIQGSQGNDIFNLTAVNQTLDYGFGLNMPVDVYNNHWTPENPNAKYPKISRTTSAQISDRFVEDGSYVRLKNIQLAYNLPVQQAVKWFRTAQLYVSGQNLVTITKYSGYDPEINSYGGSNSIRQGIDHYSYPPFKAVTVGIRCGF
ncbi:TonB-dependent receptor [Chitinophaga sp.]|uniref:SusC/RagA family TonB-linked outer membrane protein n=1 Tax=Chitinophaga sp. TaxID=1869181 RepID=UPI0031D008EE